jgi:glutamate---cysteine ligase / carboxylate-amine ligase
MSGRHDAYFAEVEERFATSTDFTIGLEEEYQILEPVTLALTPGYEELRRSAPASLDGHLLGELISSEIELATARCDDFSQAAREMTELRPQLFAHAAAHNFALGLTGTHPFSSWKDQEIIDTPHYRAVEDLLKYVAWRNNTWSNHVHVGINGLDRAVVVGDTLRGYLPHVLALSANSPFIEGVWTQLASARVQTFVRMFPRCGVPDVFGSWAEHRRFYELLLDVGSIREFTQLWWSVRPHHRYGTVEVRIADVQTEQWQSLAVSAFAVGLVVLAARRYDEGRPLPVYPTRYVEENLWRAIRYGLDGKLVDFEARREVPAIEVIAGLVAQIAPLAGELGLQPHLDDVARILDEGNGTQRQVRALAAGLTIEQIFAGTVEQAKAEPATRR